MFEKIEKIRRDVTKALRTLPIAGPAARYDLEYSSATELAELTGVRCQFEGTHYWFWSPVLDEIFLQEFVIPDKKIIDVGAGNGALIKELISLGCQPECLSGVDISRRAVSRIKETGARAFHGSLSGIPTGEKWDVIFLSYFVDRDNDQRGTFETAVRILADGGVIVLEGLFPCVLQDSMGTSYGTQNVTFGEDAEEDIRLVTAEFARLGMKLQKRNDGERYVYSMDGPETLPSKTLVFSR